MAETWGFRIIFSIIFNNINIESLALHLGRISEHFFFYILKVELSQKVAQN